MIKSCSSTSPVKFIYTKDLPLTCPQSDDPLWALHPRVFLPIEESENQKIICPYCSTHYELKETP
jgi:uncharacterized Zn-finger protein